MAEDKPPSFQFYPRDFLSSGAVTMMTPEARGGYVMLLCHAWLSDDPGTLPDDDSALAALSGLGDRWSICADSIRRAFQRSGPDAKPMLTQPRLKHEREQQLAYRCQQSLAGEASAASLSPEQRKERSRVAANARWHANDANGVLTHAKSASASASALASEPKHLSASADVSPSLNGHTRKARIEAEPEGFAVAYAAYPRRTKRRAAAKAFAAFLKRHPDCEPQDVLNAARAFAQRVADLDMQFIPHPSSWLNSDQIMEEFADETAAR